MESTQYIHLIKANNMKKFLILFFLLIPIFTFSQIVTLVSNTYSVDRGGSHSEKFFRPTKIKIYDDKIKFIYKDRLIPSKLKLTNVRVYVIDGNLSITAQIKCKGDPRYLVLYLYADLYSLTAYNMLDVEYKNYIKTFKISKIDKNY